MNKLEKLCQIQNNRFRQDLFPFEYTSTLQFIRYVNYARICMLKQA